MAEESSLPKPKKSVALSGTVAGNTAVCTVGRTGNDLHYRGYDILDFADQAEFEEIAHLLIHGTLPDAAQLKSYKSKLKSLRSLPQPVKQVLEAIPAECAPDGCDAHRLFDARHLRTGAGPAQRSRGKGPDRPDAGLFRLDADVLAPIQHFRTPHRRGNERR